VKSLSWRWLTLVGNVVLILLTSQLVWGAVRGHQVPDDERPPAGFDPVRYDLPPSERGQSLAMFASIWTTLDRPEPEPEPVIVEQQVAPAEAGPASPDRLFEVILVMEDADETRSSAIVQRRGGSSQRSVGVGDRLDDGSLVVAIQVRLQGDERTAVLLLERGQQTFELAVREPPG
jgi:hypothetical protein